MKPLKHFRKILMSFFGARGFTREEKDIFVLSPIEDFFLLFVILGGFIYHWNPMKWSSAYVGNTQYGDAEFWWNGAIQFSKGIFPGNGFRPGYAILTGLSLAVVGTQFLFFQKFLVGLLLGSCTFTYLIFRKVLGVVCSALGLILLVFNPYTAEWVSTTTTDATGLILHLLSIGFLFFGIKNSRLRLLHLAAFSFFFAMGTLTRPLLTPYLGIVLISLLTFKTSPLKDRLKAIALVLVVFITPSLGWMTFQRFNIGEWSVSSNDASAFYAASDPAIQVWTNEMYVGVEKSAKARNHIEHVSVPQLNQEFWNLTFENYRKHWRYHLRRVLPNVWEFSRFSPSISNHPNWSISRLLFILLAGGFLLRFGYNKNFLGAISSLFVLGLLYRFKHGNSLFLLLGCCYCVSFIFRKNRNFFLPQSLLAAFWLVGVLALTLVGGTWGPVSGHPVVINPLGYRLGSQFFFAGDFISLFFLMECFGRLTKFDRNGKLFHLPVAWEKMFLANSVPNLTSGRVVPIFLGSTAAVFLIVQAVGAVVVGGRFLSRQLSVKVPFPSTTSVRSALLPSRLISQADELVTGATSDLIWNLPGQERAQVLFYPQKMSFPLEITSNRRMIEFSSHLIEEQWKGRQGIFFLRDFKRSGPASNMPYYVDETAVRGFVPLSQDRLRYDLDKAEWFPIAKYASRLVASGELKFNPNLFQWNSDSGKHLYQRRFLLKESSSEHFTELLLDLSKSRGRRFLTFNWSSENGGPTIPPFNTKLEMLLVRSDGVVTPHQVSRSSGESKSEKVQLNDSEVKLVRLRFSEIPVEGVHIYEFNLVADQFL